MYIIRSYTLFLQCVVSLLAEMVRHLSFRRKTSVLRSSFFLQYAKTRTINQGAWHV